MTDKPLVIAHRGGVGPWPENTIGAFLHGLALGADGVELDVHLSADGIAVVHHDEALGRVFAGDRRVCDATVAELQAASPIAVIGAMTAGTMSDAALSRIPTLEEVLAAITGCGTTHVNVELKTDALSYPGIEETVAAILGEHPRLSCVISSFNPSTLARFVAISPDVPTALLDHRPGSETVAAALRIGATGIHPNHSRFTQDVMAAAHEANLAVRPYTVNSRDAMHRLTAWGVDALITDDVEAAARGIAFRLL